MKNYIYILYDLTSVSTLYLKYSTINLILIINTLVLYNNVNIVIVSTYSHWYALNWIYFENKIYLKKNKFVFSWFYSLNFYYLRYFLIDGFKILVKYKRKKYLIKRIKQFYSFHMFYWSAVHSFKKKLVDN